MATNPNVPLICIAPLTMEDQSPEHKKEASILFKDEIEKVETDPKAVTH